MDDLSIDLGKGYLNGTMTKYNFVPENLLLRSMETKADFLITPTLDML